MLKEKEKIVQVVTAAFDAVVLFFVFISAFAFRQFFHRFYSFNLLPSLKIVPDMMAAPISEYIVVMFLVIPIWCFMLSVNGMYQSMRTKTLLEVSWTVIKAAFFTMFIFGAAVFLLKLKFVSRLFFTLFMACASFSLIAEKMMIFAVMHRVRKHGYNYRGLLIVGTGRRAADFINRIKSHPEWGFKIVGIIEDEKGHEGRKVEDVDIIGHIDDIQSILHNNPVDEVVFIVPRSRLDSIENALYTCETAGIKATVAVDLFELKIAKSRQNELEGIPLITFETTPALEWELFLKRLADLALSGLGIALLSPLFLITAALIKTTSRGPVMFKQERMGLNGRKFTLYKFRTMYEGAEKKLDDLRAMNEMTGPVFKIKNDPRITLLGKALRKLSIDEMPQLFNVFLGHMSLVGPRPPLASEVAIYKPWQRRRLSMRPGITCLWQISGRNKIGFEEWMKLDLEYIDNWSLWLDFKILIKTIPVVMFGIGAY